MSTVNGMSVGKKTLQQAMRERREAAPLVTAAEASRREAARRREEDDAAAVAALRRWRGQGSPDGRALLSTAAYRRLFELSSAAYYASGHWSRRRRDQLALAPACEVVACGAVSGVEAHHLRQERIGEEEPGRDLITLCAGCRRRAWRLGQELRRPPTRTELAALDPGAPLYHPGAIAALKAKYGSGRADG